MSDKKSQSNIIYPNVKIIDISKAFWRGVKPYKWLLFFVLFCVVSTNIVAIITPIFYKQFFDVIVSVSDKIIIAQKLLYIITYIAILNGVLWVLYRAHSFSNSKFQAAVIAKLKQQAYDYLMKHSYGFFSNNFTGSLVQKVNRFGKSFERLADRVLWDLLSLVIRAISIIIIVFFINKLIASVIFIWSVVFVVFNVSFSIWKMKYDIAVATIDSKVTGYLADTITNQNTIHLFNGIKFESKKYKDMTDEQARVTRFNWNLLNLIEAGQSFLGFTIEFLLFYFTIKYWQQGLVTIGFFVLLQVYILYLIDQLWSFTRITRDIYQAYADAKEMVEIMLLPHEIKDVPSAVDLKVGKGVIEFKGVGFNFNETRKVLSDINLVINPGEKVALIGPSGAGKTTFVRLLLRLYELTEGEILIDGQNTAKVTQESLRKNISMVPQDPVLFHRTLAENIGYGKCDASKKEIKKAAKLAHCDEFIKDLPYGLETYVGERGIKLSGGERQRVAIARAILKNAPILILDEATSSLDSHSELLIQDALQNLMAGKTTIVIAHRLSTIQKMDRIIVVDDGKIIEEGSHKELLGKEGSLYKKLWNLQAGGFLADENEEELEPKVELKEEEY